MSIKKSYRKNSDLCSVSFKLSEEQTIGANRVHIVGEFNDWNTEATAMKSLKNGGFSKTLSLKKRTGISVSLFGRWKFMDK